MRIPHGQVTVIPISWFEEEYQVRLCDFDANTKEIKSDAEVIFGNIKQNLNPNITDPPTSCAKQMLITKRSDRGDGYNE